MKNRTRWIALALVATLAFSDVCSGATVADGLAQGNIPEITAKMDVQTESQTETEVQTQTEEQVEAQTETTANTEAKTEVQSEEKAINCPEEEQNDVTGQESEAASQDETTKDLTMDGLSDVAETTEESGGNELDEKQVVETVTVDLIQEGKYVPLPNEEEIANMQKLPEVSEGLSMERGELLSYEDYLVQEFKKKNTSISVSAYGYSPTDFVDVTKDIMNSHPELYYVSGAFGYSYRSGESDLVTVLRPTYNSYTAEQMDLFDAEVNKPLELIDPTMDTIEKALTIHDYIVSDVEYAKARLDSNTLIGDDYNMYGIVASKIGVCNGYALTFNYYMRQLGIPCEMVYSSDHAWNQIQVGSKWYQIDCTWDDPTWDVPGRVQHTYFLKSDSFWSEDAGAGSGGHHWNKKRYDCTDTQYDGTSTLLYNCKTAAYKNPTDKNWYYLTGNTYVKGDKTSFWATSTSGVQVIKTISEVWNVWGKSSYWVGCFSKVIPRTEYVIYSDKQNIYYMNYDGTTTKTLYTLNSTERTQGYIYGIRVKNNKIQYMYATIPNETGPNMKFGSVDFPVLSGATTFTADMLDVTLPTGVIYDGQAHKPTVRIKSAYVGGAGKVTVTIKDSAGNITANPENAGTYDVYASVSTGITYAALSQTKVGSFTINKAALDSEQLNISALDVVYDGTERLASVTTHNSLVGVGSIVVEYEDEAGENVLAPTNAGIYNVYVSVGEGSNYTGLDRYLAASYEITKADLSLNHLTKGTNQVVYDGTPKYLECSLNSSLVGAGALTLTYEDMDGNEIEQPTELGTYKVYVNVAPGSNYNGLEKQLYSYFYILETLPSPTPTVTLPPSQNITEDPSNNPWDDYEDVYEVEVGDEFESGKLVFEITAVGNKNTVRVVEPVTNKIKSVTIPDKVSYEGITFSVTEIAPKAFMGCKNLKKITVKATGLKKVGKKAFSGIYYRAVVKVPKKQLKLYQKLFKNKGQKSTVKIK